jgi:hypothetical protein
MGKWRHVGVGDIIQSKGVDPVAWKVTGRPKTGPNAGAVVVEREGKHKVIPAAKCPPDGDVNVLLSMSAAMDQAIALAQVSLGGKVQAIQRAPDEPYRVPVDFVHPGELRSHAWLLHGKALDTGDEDWPGLVQEHALLHHPGRKDPRYLDHVHDPDFIRHLEAMRAGEGLR